MNKITLLALLLAVVLSACRAQSNQYKNKQKHGKWVYKTSEKTFTSGRYRKGEQVGTWKTIQEGNLYRKERFRKGSSLVRFYHTNGKLMSKGKTESAFKEDLIHWYYTGRWNYYDDQGKIFETRTYYKGEPIVTDTVKRK